MDVRSVIMGIAFVFMWSSAFTSARLIVTDAPPMLSLSLRFLISGLIAVAIARMLGQSWRLTPSQLRATIVFGICQNALYLGLFFIAMQTVEASLASIIASSMPLLVALAGWIFFKDRPGLVASIGLIAGLSGVVIVLGTRLGAGADPRGLILCAIGVAALSLATLSVRGASSGGNVLMIVGLQMLIGAAALLVPSMLFEDWVVSMNPVLVTAFVYTTLVPGLAATVIWFQLVNRIGTVRAATYHFLNPAFGVAVAAVTLGEQIRPTDIIGVIITTLGILAVQLDKRSRLQN